MIPGWWPTRVYFGWALVTALGITATVSYGILSYSFAVFITPMSNELGWSKATITGAFSIAQLVAGVTALPLGRWVDRHGARGLMSFGSLLATAMLIAWSQVQSVAAYYGVWALIGVALAAVLYEPAFAVVATWFNRDRARALTLLTFLGGFASVIFVPTSTLLVERFGWRHALWWLAGINALVGVGLHALVLRRRPGDLGLEPDGRSIDARTVTGTASRDVGRQEHASTSDAIRSGAFRWLTIAFALSALSTTAVSVHLVPLLLERGYDARFAGAAMGVLGLMALPGRLVLTPLGTRWSRPRLTALIFAFGAFALAMLLWSRGPFAVWIFVILFGAGFGAITPARAALMAETFGATRYGEISGVLALVISVARAGGPVGASLLYGRARGYDTVLVVLVVLSGLSAVAVLRAGVTRGRSRLPLPLRQ